MLIMMSSIRTYWTLEYYIGEYISLFMCFSCCMALIEISWHFIREKKKMKEIKNYVIVNGICEWSSYYPSFFVVTIIAWKRGWRKEEEYIESNEEDACNSAPTSIDCQSTHSQCLVLFCCPYSSLAYNGYLLEWPLNKMSLFIWASSMVMERWMDM